MTIKEAKNIHCLGIGGIGVSAVARIILAQGKNVSGSDLKSSNVTDGLQKLGIKISIGPNSVPADADLVIYTPAVPEDELALIKIPKLSHGQAVGELMDGQYGIAVTGTNGKSTTTAMLGLILEQAGLEPTVLVGSLISPLNETAAFKANARLGTGRYFVAESDEYQGKMLQNRPRMIVMTNIAEDHLDYYQSLGEIKKAFLQYVMTLPPDGLLIYNADDHNTVEVCREAKCHKFTFGIKHYADLQAINLNATDGKQHFDLHLNDEKIGEFELPVPGAFNVSNALGATLAAIKLGVDSPMIAKTLAGYKGIWRRFEQVGTLEGKPVISDYAHHPDGITGTIEAAREFYPGKKVLAVFQPHHRNRTEKLKKEFVQSLLGADEVIMLEIFDVAGREQGEQISSADLVAEIKERGGIAAFAEDFTQAEALIRKRIGNFDAILMMGAGDIDQLARKLTRP